MHKLGLIQLGCGTIGRELISQIIGGGNNLPLEYIGLFRSHQSLCRAGGVPKRVLSDFCKVESDSSQWTLIKNGDVNSEIMGLIRGYSGPFLLVDVTASTQTQSIFQDVLAAGGGVVSANKIPFTSLMENWDGWFGASNYLDTRLRIETTVGAGLPILRTIGGLLETGDQIDSMKGCLSGTLSFLFHRMGEGDSFSSALAAAQSKGMTEPDPREDLSGMDVARKVLILSRIAGMHFELEDVEVENLIPSSYSRLSADEFQSRSNELDQGFDNLVRAAKSRGKKLCYIGTVEDGKLRVGMEEVDLDSSFGTLKGSENLCVIQSTRYKEHLIIRGPGAGPEVTASGVFHDILDLSRILQGSE